MGHKMNKLRLIDNKVVKSDIISVLAKKLDFTIEDFGQEIAVIINSDTKEELALISFCSDSGANYPDTDKGTIKVIHEILHLDKGSWMKDNKENLEECLELISNWMFKYILVSAVQQSEPIGHDNGHSVFEVGINVEADNNGLLGRAYNLINRQSLNDAFKALGYSNHVFIK